MSPRQVHHLADPCEHDWTAAKMPPKRQEDVSPYVDYPLASLWTSTRTLCWRRGATPNRPPVNAHHLQTTQTKRVEQAAHHCIRHGFNKKTLKLFVTDFLQSAGLVRNQTHCKLLVALFYAAQATPNIASHHHPVRVSL
eukprot:1789327-Amphidinium_carterae.1